MCTYYHYTRQGKGRTSALTLAWLCLIGLQAAGLVVWTSYHQTRHSGDRTSVPTIGLLFVLVSCFLGLVLGGLSASSRQVLAQHLVTGGVFAEASFGFLWPGFLWVVFSGDVLVWMPWKLRSSFAKQ